MAADNVLFAAAVLYGYGDAARVLIFSPIQDVLKSENQQMFRPTIEEDVMRQVRLYHSGVKGHDVSYICNDYLHSINSFYTYC